MVKCTESLWLTVGPSKSLVTRRSLPPCTFVHAEVVCVPLNWRIQHVFLAKKEPVMRDFGNLLKLLAEEIWAIADYEAMNFKASSTQVVAVRLESSLRDPKAAGYPVIMTMLHVLVQ
jgi:hypothetical protein